MKIEGKSYKTIWFENNLVKIIDQTKLPHQFAIKDLKTVKDAINAIKTMEVRGAPLIGATAAYGLVLSIIENNDLSFIKKSSEELIASRPTAINLKWAVDRMMKKLNGINEKDILKIALDEAKSIKDEDEGFCKNIGLNGLKIIEEISNKKKGTVNILTHCNAGWLATVDWGTATSPMYQAHNLNIPIHVWVDETRPRNQGALTAWELKSHGISHNYITDNAGGHLMQHGLVDMVIVGTDRTTSRGDVCNKIGTYLKALAAKDNNIPFYVALPSPTIDWTIEDGINEIPIEERSESEVSLIQGKNNSGVISKLKVTPEGTIGSNPAFDVTPAKLITGLITEKGVCEASSNGLQKLFPKNNQKDGI